MGLLTHGSHGDVFLSLQVDLPSFPNLKSRCLPILQVAVMFVMPSRLSDHVVSAYCFFDSFLEIPHFGVLTYSMAFYPQLQHLQRGDLQTF